MIADRWPAVCRSRMAACRMMAPGDHINHQAARFRGLLHCTTIGEHVDMKKLSAPGRRASTKRMAFKADGDDLVEEISAIPTAAPAKAAPAAPVEDDAVGQAAAKAEAERAADASRQQAEQERAAALAEKKKQQALEQENTRRQKAEAEAEAQREMESALERQRLKEEEEDRRFEAEEARRAAEDEAELEKLRAEIAEKDRVRQEAVAAAEAERLRILRELEEENDAEQQAQVAAAARALAETKAKSEAAARARAVEEESERVRVAALEEEARVNAAKEAEWKRLMEEEEALQQREQAAQAEQQRQEQAAAARREQERLERERLDAEAAAERETKRLEAERTAAAEAVRREEERLEQLRLQEERAEALRLQQQQEREEEEAAMAEAAAAEEELRRRQAELEEKRLAAVAREEAEAAEQRRKVEEARRKRQSFLSDTDAFSSNFESQNLEKDEKLKAVKDREVDLLGGEIKSSGENFSAAVPTKRIVEEPAVATAPAIPGPEPPAQPEPEPEQQKEPTIKQSAEASANFTALTSSLFGEDEKKETLFVDGKEPAAEAASDPATAAGSVGLFGDSTGGELFSNRTFAVKKKKDKQEVATSSAAGASSGVAPSPTEDDVDWDAIESEGRVDALSGDMRAQWKARQVDLTTKRMEFRGAVCYGLGGIFAWQMYSAAESRDELGKPYTEYLMRCQWGTKWDNMQPWLVARRYREFDFLDTNIRKEFPSLKDQLIPLPGKALLSFGQASVPERTRGIEDYMINILNTVPQVLKSSHMYIFLDLTERIEGIRRKIKETERNGGAAPSPTNLPVPGAKKELGKATAGEVSAANPKAEPSFTATKNTGVAGFGPDGLHSSLVPDRSTKEVRKEEVDVGPVDPLEINELYDDAKVDEIRLRENSRMLDDDSLGVLEENIRDLIEIAKRTRAGDVQKNAKLIRALRLCQSQWPSLRATCTIDADPLSSTSMLVPRAMQAEEDLDRVVKEIKSVLIAQSIGSPLHF